MAEIVKYKLWVGMLLHWRNTDTIDIVRVSRINSKVVYLYNYKKECEEHVYLGFLYQKLTPHWLQEKDIIEVKHKTMVKANGVQIPTRYQVEYIFFENISLSYYYKVKYLVDGRYYELSESKIHDTVELISL